MRRLVEVDHRQARNDFAKLPFLLFQQHPDFVPVPQRVVDQLFDPRQNTKAASLQHKRWVLYEGDKPIGRIAAFEHPKPVPGEKAGGIGFFDCINDPQTAQLLFQAAENWLRSIGCEAWEGPLNFGENDQFWGLLVQGFERPSFGMNWNPPYYQDFFEQNGFQPYYEQITNSLNMMEVLPERFERIATRVMNKPQLELKHLRKSRLKYFAAAVVQIFNHAWQDFENFSPITEAKVRNDFRRLKPILRPDLVWFAFVDGQAAAFMLLIPDLNDSLRSVGYVSNLWSSIKWLVKKRFVPIHKMKVVAMGVHQKYQKTGLESALIKKVHAVLKARYPSVTQIELAWVGDFNEPMLALHRAAAAQPLRLHRTYRKHADPSVLVKKFSIKTA